MPLRRRNLDEASRTSFRISRSRPGAADDRLHDEPADRRCVTRFAPGASPVESSAAPPAGPSAAPSAGRAEAAQTSRCRTSEVRVTAQGAPGGGAAGDLYEWLVFTNTSARTCTLFGFPGVSYVRGPSGTQVNQPARRTSDIPHRISLKPRQSAHAQVHTGQPGIFPGRQVRPVQVDGYRVYRPTRPRPCSWPPAPSSARPTAPTSLRSAPWRPIDGRPCWVRLAAGHCRTVDYSSVLAGVRRRRQPARREIAARHADPRTTMRYDRARKNLDRHPNYILAAYMASGT